jgi:3'(2'), 5'-bisphosphate nucleotidase
MQLGDFWQGLAQDLLPVFQHYRTHLRTLDVQVKTDKTLLTEADITIERLIVDRIRGFHPDAVIVAEEDGKVTQRTDVLASPELIWVIDPIDGTAEFVRPGRVEFCSVVCLLQHLKPIAAFVLAPELGQGQEPIMIVADSTRREVMVNGDSVDTSRNEGMPRLASVTRSSDSSPRAFEAVMRAAAYTLKTKTTSQTLDMVRTALDIDRFTSGGFGQFSLFYRAQQKAWDGLAGLCLGEAVGLRTAGPKGEDRLPVDMKTLSLPEPIFDATIMGTPKEVEWFLEITHRQGRAPAAS